MSKTRRLIRSFTFPTDSNLSDDQIKEKYQLRDNGTIYHVERSYRGRENKDTNVQIYEEIPRCYKPEKTNGNPASNSIDEKVL